MHPRQYDLTVNFFPRMSCGTNVSRILLFLCTFGILPTQRAFPVSNQIFQVIKVLLCTNLQQFVARFLALESIVQRLKPFLYKDLVYRICLFCVLTPCARFHPCPLNGAGIPARILSSNTNSLKEWYKYLKNSYSKISECLEYSKLKLWNQKWVSVKP